MTKRELLSWVRWSIVPVVQIILFTALAATGGVPVVCAYFIGVFAILSLGTWIRNLEKAARVDRGDDAT